MKNNSRNITKKDISKSIYSKYGTSEKTISLFVDNLFNILKIILKKEKKFNLKNIGTFKILNKSQRIGRNPKTGEHHLISERKSISFKVSESLRNKINNE
tara:strand:+ start:275 stop:574 length:300 start_codon:yes stop_codon:yes gene_type:complete